MELPATDIVACRYDLLHSHSSDLLQKSRSHTRNSIEVFDEEKMKSIKTWLYDVIDWKRSKAHVYIVFIKTLEKKRNKNIKWNHFNELHIVHIYIQCSNMNASSIIVYR